MRAKMDVLEAERTRLEPALGAVPELEPVALHPSLAGIYVGRVLDLAELAKHIWVLVAGTGFEPVTFRL